MSRLIWLVSRWHQIGLLLLTVAVFLLSTVPLELQRRIVDDAIRRGAPRALVLLSVAYLAVAVLEGLLKWALNVYRGWVGENAVRHLRRSILGLVQDSRVYDSGPEVEGVEISMILAEAEPIGGFVGASLSEPLLQLGILVSVFLYLLSLQPIMAGLTLLILAPQAIFIPMMQRAINRRAQSRIQVLRQVSAGILEAEPDDLADRALQKARFDLVLDLNMSIFKLKFSMNFLMNALHHGTVATTLALGGYYAIVGKIDVGTIVAFVSGIIKINDPIGDLVSWFRDLTTTAVKYRLITDAITAAPVVVPIGLPAMAIDPGQ